MRLTEALLSAGVRGILSCFGEDGRSAFPGELGGCFGDVGWLDWVGRGRVPLKSCWMLRMRVDAAEEGGQCRAKAWERTREDWVGDWDLRV